MKNIDINTALSTWSIFIQFMIELPLLVIFILGWISTKKRVMLLWTIAWILNLTALGFVYYASKTFINNSKLFFNFFYESYGIFKISFAFLLLFSAYQYLKKDRLIKFPFIYFLPSISIIFVLFTLLKAVVIQFFVYGSVSFLFFWSALILYKYLNGKDRIIMSIGFTVSGLSFAHHFFILISYFFGKKVPTYMSRISFYDAISEFMLALSFFLSIIICTIDELRLTNQKLTDNQKTLRTLVDFDPLTGLRNRRVLREFMEDAKKKKGIMVFMDVDNFKMLNDKFGHTFGDRCLTTIAENLKNVFRVNDGLFRYGGDEFLLIIVGLTINEVKKRVDEAIYKTNLSLSDFNLMVSYGISEINANSDFKKILNKVDKQMYSIKKRDHK